MADGGPELPTSPSSPSLNHQNGNGPLLSQHVLIGLTSLAFILVIVYPWLIAVTVISFAVGFTCVEHLDRLVKSSISGGRFGSNVQAFFKEYINEREVTTSHKTCIKEVNVDPLRDYLEVNESRKGSVQSQSSEGEGKGNKHGIQIHHSLAIPEELIPSSSNRSSPERTRSARDSPILNLSAASSRRVSEDVLSSTLGGNNVQVQQQHHWRESNNKTPSPSKSSNAGSTPSPSLALSSEISTLRVDKEFRVDARIDLAFGKMFTNILNYYISPSWAPYETRRQLRLSFKQLLTTVAEHLNKRLLICKGDSEYPPLVKITRQKLVPLLLHYLDKILARGLSTNDLDEPIISKDSRRRIVLKIRKFCRQISQKFLNKDDQKCKLWMELVIAVLADGVLVNVINLGRDKLPELFEDLVTNYKKTSRAATTPRGSSPSPAKSVSSRGESVNANNRHLPFVDPLSDNYPAEEASNLLLSQQHKEETTSERSADFSSVGGDCNLNEMTMTAVVASSTSAEKVPFLLDSFLDPPFNLDKPDPIVSRWRPTLKDIVSETDLLYPLIQYMKHVGGQQSLVYLQGVLDDYPQEGDPYCRRVLELEYLPGFCRSSLLLETMGLNRVEMALEVGADLLNMRRNSNGGHARSASYGGPASSSSSFREFLKIERGIVDGLPLTESSGHLSSLSSSSSEQSGSGVSSGGGTTAATLPGAGAIEPSLAFKRRPHLEMYIAKFIKSTTKSWKQYYDPLADKLEPVKRAGIDGKSYEEWDHPEVNSRVRIYATNEDIYDSLVELVTNLMRNSPLASPFLSGLTHFLKPYLMPVFDSQIDKSLSHALSVDLLILVVDLIAEVFEESPDDMNIEENHKPNDDHHDRDDATGGSTSQSPFKTSKSGLLSDDDVVSNPEDDTSHHHNSSCTTCDPSFKSSFKSFLLKLLERFTLNLIDLEHFVKCCKKNREYIFLFFVDLLDVLVSELVEK